MNKRRTLGELAAECDAWRREGKNIVWTNGCFDIFHAGHAKALEVAKTKGDILIVGLNSDRSVRELKEKGRPLCNEDERAEVIGALEAVDRVLLFDGKRCVDELQTLKPDVWTKSGDYTEESLDQDERRSVLSHGGRIVITPFIPGISTSLLVKKIRRFDPEKIVSAACAFIKDGGRLLMVATRYADGVKWGLPGGGHNHGETLPETARRETREETGLDVEILRPMGVIERIEPSRWLHLNLHVFEAKIADGAAPEQFSPRLEEDVVDAAWFDRRRMLDEKQTVLGRRLWQEYGEHPELWPPYILMRPGEE